MNASKQCLRYPEIKFLYYVEPGGIVESGPHERLTGDWSGLWGDCSGTYGNATGFIGDITGFKGDLDGIPLSARKGEYSLIEFWR